MSRETLLLIGRETGASGGVYRTHAGRLAEWTGLDAVEVRTYERDPVSELSVADCDADRVYAMPMTPTHTRATRTDIPSALAGEGPTVVHCDPVGRSPAITDALYDRARAALAPDAGVSLALVGLGSASTPHCRATTDYHARRLADSDYEEVLTCYLVQNPTAECVRYAASGRRLVVVPFFVAPGPATDRRIPDAVEADRGGVAVGAPLGSHVRVTAAIHAELRRQRTLASEGAAAVEPTPKAVATDGNGGDLR